MSFKATYAHEGYRADYTPGSDTLPGSVVVQGGLTGIVTEFIPANTLGSLCIKGAFDILKESGAGSGFTAGQSVYWNATDQKASNSSSGTTLMGVAEVAAADGAATVRVLINHVA